MILTELKETESLSGKMLVFLAKFPAHSKMTYWQGRKVLKCNANEKLTITHMTEVKMSV